MDSTLSDNIIQHMIDSFCWTQSCIYINLDENVIENLVEALGEIAEVPCNAPYQTEQYFKGSKFQLPGFVVSDSTTMKEDF